MERNEKRSIGDVAAMAGVSVRALRLYDEMGLVSPAGRTVSGYRMYGESDLLRLQQVLFYRELDVPLDEIKRILDAPDFNPVETLRHHRKLLEVKQRRLARLIITIDRTIRRMNGEDEAITLEELYEGFDAAAIERYERESKERWGGTEAYEESRQRITSMTKDEWKRVRARGAELEAGFAAAFRAGAAPDGTAAAGLCALWAEHLRAFYEPTPDIVAGLGRMYANAPDFRDRYENLVPGLADWLAAALESYAHEMTK